MHMQAQSFNQASSLTLCATARLARALQLHEQQQLSTNNPIWQTPQIATLHEWLADFSQLTLLASETNIQVLPNIALSNISEKMLWQQAIQSVITKHTLADLFDVASLADAAIEANQLLIDWQVSDDALNAYYQSTETRQFMRWRQAFQQLCTQHNALEPARLMALQIDCILNATLPLPCKIALAGFDRITPLMKRLIDGLNNKNSVISFIQLTQHSQQLQQVSYDSLAEECRAAVAWAKQTLMQNPQANIAIVSPILGNIRAQLADLLDDTFHSNAVHPSQYETARIYDFSVGIPLSEYCLIATALKLLKLAGSAKSVAQTDVNALLLDVNWGDLSELDARSLLDAELRKKLASQISLNALTMLAHKLNNNIGALSLFLSQLKQLQTTQKSWREKQYPKQKPSLWAIQFGALLDCLNWAKTRSLTSFEYQAQLAWQEAITRLAELDALSNDITATDAIHKLQQICTAKMFLPESIGNTRIQILGMLESSAKPLDGVWVLGMNDQHWPPPAKPNPLLPIALQRDFLMPNTNTDIQAVFAQKIHNRMINSAHSIVFSWAKKDADRELRASPLLHNMPFANPITPVLTLAETLSKQVSPSTELLKDHIAPPILMDEKLRGGSKLFEAQAICPAWTFYQYRLGAVQLESPTDGLDSMARGNLVHAALQHFWLSCKNSRTLKSLSAIALNNAISAAIAAGFEQANLNEHIAKQIIAIEKQRLQQLLFSWLQLEMQRADFTVEACEAQFPLIIAGLAINLRIDRIDAIENEDADKFAAKKLIVIDYKTGSTTPNHNNWADARISAPQLPLYASLALLKTPTSENLSTNSPAIQQQVIATCFAKVNVYECKFSGLADADILPNVTSFADLKTNSPFKQFEHFPALVLHWQQSLTAIAIEIKTGVAGVIFKNETDLLYCDVKPLLRLPERELQFEQ